MNDDPLRTLVLLEESGSANKTIVTPVREGLSEAESRALDLILQGVKKTAVFAEVLGIAHLPVEVQRAEVNRVKNMLKKRIERKKGGDDRPA
jgi:FixJ family two-component response regulator